MKTFIRSKKTFTRLFIAVLFSLWGLGGLFAQDTIQFTWQVTSQGSKDFAIHFQYDIAQYILNWGDGNIDTLTDYGGVISHTYAYARDYTVTIFILNYGTTPTPNVRFLCHERNLTALYISKNQKLGVMNCSDNHIPLSDLYSPSLKIYFKRRSKMNFAEKTGEK